MAKTIEPLIKFITLYRAPAGSPVKLGVWNSDLDACKAYADEYAIPMVAVWSNLNCGHCEIFERAIMSDAFCNWTNACNMVLCYTCSEDPFGKNELHESPLSKYKFFCKISPSGTLTNFPFVRFYWYKDNGKTRVVDFNVKGDTVDKRMGMYRNSYDKAGNYCIDYITKVAFPDYDPSTPISKSRFLVSFANDDGTTLKEAQLVEKGADAVPPEDVPTRDGFTFACWQPDYHNILNDTICTAKYIKGSYVLVKEDNVDNGAAATPPELQQHFGYRFVGWSTDFSNVTSDLSVYALYEEDLSYENPRTVTEISRKTTLFKYK